MRIVLYIILGLFGFVILSRICLVILAFIARKIKCAVCPFRGDHCVPNSFLCSPSTWPSRRDK